MLSRKSQARRSQTQRSQNHLRSPHDGSRTALRTALRWSNRFTAAFLFSALLLGTTFSLNNKRLTPAATATAYGVPGRISQLKASPSSRWIEVQLNEQQILVWEGNQVVYSSVISSGSADRPTREGTFEIQSMHISARMRGGDYDVPDVPYTMYYSGHYALHGAYWHSNFGTPVSHGCINLPIVAADWIFSWAHVGTPVIVH